MAFKSSIQIDNMQPFGTLIAPVPGHLHRIIRKHGIFVFLTLLQTHGFAVLDIDSGKKNHKPSSLTALRIPSTDSCLALTHWPLRLKNSPTVSRFSVSPTCFSSNTERGPRLSLSMLRRKNSTRTWAELVTPASEPSLSCQSRTWGTSKSWAPCFLP